MILSARLPDATSSAPMSLTSTFTTVLVLALGEFDGEVCKLHDSPCLVHDGCGERRDDRAGEPDGDAC